MIRCNAMMKMVHTELVKAIDKLILSDSYTDKEKQGQYKQFLKQNRKKEESFVEDQGDDASKEACPKEKAKAVDESFEFPKIPPLMPDDEAEEKVEETKEKKKDSYDFDSVIDKIMGAVEEELEREEKTRPNYSSRSSRSEGGAGNDGWGLTEFAVGALAVAGVAGLVYAGYKTFFAEDDDITIVSGGDDFQTF